MKTRIFITTVALLLLIVSGTSSQNTGTPMMNEPVKIFTTPETRSLTEVWISEYRQTNSDFNCELIPIGLAEINSEITGDRTIGFVRQWHNVSSSFKSMWLMTLGREVIVAVMNSENPYKSELGKRGASPDKIGKLFGKQEYNGWGSLLSSQNHEPVNIYILDKPEVKLSVAKFLEADPTEMNTVKALSQDEFLVAVKKDKYALGFCKLSTITNIGTQDFLTGIQLLPIDQNKNGRLDYNENFYSNLEQFERSVWIGKYPHAMVYDIYAVSSSFPGNAEINSFLSWITSTGQILVEQSGYTELVYSEKQSNLEKLIPPALTAETQLATSTRSLLLLWGIVVVLAAFLFFVIARYFIRKQKAKAPLLNKTRHVKLLNEVSLNFPDGLYFDKSYTWVFMEKGGRVKLGVDDFISNVTGKYTRVIMKSPGEKVKRMEPVVTLIRKGKQITLNSPVSGTIKEINENLVADPFTINNSPYEEGWIYKIEPSNWLREIQFFKMGSSYRNWISGEFIRLKDFLACSLYIMNLEEEKLAFQEGGELMLHPLKDLDPKVWEDFQNHFINTADMY